MATTRDGVPSKRRPRRRGGVLRRWLVPVIGGITPVGLIVVNIAAFIVHHLDTFRVVIAISAFVSGVLLGTWQALIAYRIIQRRMPQAGLANERNEEVVLMIGMGIVLVMSAVIAFLCYKGLEDEKALPNALTFLTGGLGIALPFVMQRFFGHAVNEAEREEL